MFQVFSVLAAQINTFATVLLFLDTFGYLLFLATTQQYNISFSQYIPLHFNVPTQFLLIGTS